MPEGFECFGGVAPFVVGMTVDTGACGNSSMQEGSGVGAVSRQKLSGDPSYSDLIRLVAGYALNRCRSAEWFVTAEALSFHRLMSFQERPRGDKHIGIR
jgi:hypothetical protein